MMPCRAVADRKHSDFEGVVDATDYRAPMHSFSENVPSHDKFLLRLKR